MPRWRWPWKAWTPLNCPKGQPSGWRSGGVAKAYRTARSTSESRRWKNDTQRAGANLPRAAPAFVKLGGHLLGDDVRQGRLSHPGRPDQQGRVERALVGEGRLQ